MLNFTTKFNIENISLPSLSLSTSLLIRLIFSIIIFFGVLTLNALHIHTIGSEMSLPTNILDIAPYSFISSLPGLEIPYINEQYNSTWKNLPVLQKAIKIYEKPTEDWQNIKKDFKNKTGIYCWVNKLNHKIYIGSASLLPKRLSYYFQPAYINRIDMIITKAILNYGLINFSLAILEETTHESLLAREDFYLKTFKPEYNILTKAGNSSGYKHTPETILKLSELNKGKKHSDLTKAKIGAANLGTKQTDQTKEKIRNTILNSENNWADKVLVTDLESNKQILFKSKLSAAEYLGLTVSAISKRDKRKTVSPYKGKYLIEFPE